MVSIIILSYNTQDLIIRCLESINKHWSSIQHEVIVVDNGSHDQSVLTIKEKFPKVTLIENNQNFGFAKGCNIGASHANGEYLLFLNSDTEFTDESIKQSLDILASFEHVAVVGCYLENNKETTSSSFGDFYTVLSIFRLLFFPTGVSGVSGMTQAHEVDWVSGGCLLIKRAVFRKLQGFDEHFFMYVEDMELCFRVKSQGNKIYFDPRTKIKHTGQGSSNRTFAIVEIYKGILYYFKIHSNLVSFMTVKCLLIMKALLSLVIGYGTHNRYLIKTYTQALRVTI